MDIKNQNSPNHKSNVKRGKTMKNRKLYIVIGIMFLSVNISGCSKTEDNSIISVFSSNVQMIDIPQISDELSDNTLNDENINASIIDDEQNNEKDQNVEEEIVLTPEEIEQLRTLSNEKSWQEALDAHESITKTGEWIDPVYHGSYNGIVGIPGDTSWRQMTDEEAQAILAEDPNNAIAKAELENGTWCKFMDGKVYFDIYKYLEASEKALEAISDQLIIYEDFEN